MSDTNQHTHTPDFTLSTGMMGKLATTVTNHYIQPIIQFRPLSNGNRGTLPSILAQQFVVGWTVSAHVSVDILRSVLAVTIGRRKAHICADDMLLQKNKHQNR
jgi:predicted cobalt transporter CbtA